jgi:hypothetical protein
MPLSFRHPAAMSGLRTSLWVVRLLAFCSSCAWTSIGLAEPARLRLSAADTPAVHDDAEARRTTMARALFEEGVRYLDAGRWEDAQDRFIRVIDLRYSPVALYNLGLAQVRLGHGVVAAATLRKLLVDPGVEPKVREPAAALLVEVEAKFGWLTLRVSDPCHGCRVYVDREEWPPAVLEVAIPIDPGKHALELRWDSAVLATASVEVMAASRVEALLAARPGSLEAARAVRSGQMPLVVAGGRRPPHAATSGGGALRSPWFWGAMGVLAAGVVTTVVIGTR